jgi:hypothetical protein
LAPGESAEVQLRGADGYGIAAFPLDQSDREREVELREEKTWWVGGSGARSVAIDGAAVEGARNAVVEAFLSLPRRGAEVGGLLLGSVAPGEPGRVRVEAFEPVPCEHRFGPSYMLSETDRAGLEERLGRERGTDAQVVGYYRSYTGREAAPDAADAELFQRYFAAPHHCFLLIRPVTVRNCAARLAFWERGEVAVQPDYRPFALDSGEAQESPAEESERVSEARKQPEPVVLPLPAAVSPVQPGAVDPPALLPPVEPLERWRRLEAEDRPRTAAARLLLWVLLCVAAGIGSALFYERITHTPEPRRAGLGLHARHTGSGLTVSWNRSAAPVLEASRGSLSIEGGGGQKEIELSEAEIRTGAFDYEGSGGDLSIELKLYGRGAPAAESIRVLKFATAAADPEPPVEPAVDPVTAAPVESPVEPPVPVERPAKPPVIERASRETLRKTAEPAVPPAVLHQVQPGIPAGIRARIRDRVIVPVTVHVSEAGRVTRAVPQPGGDGLHRYLAGYAGMAARWWRFEPARTRSGDRVAATKTIYFVFTP